MQTVDDIFTAYARTFEVHREAEMSLREAEKSLAEYFKARKKDGPVYSTAIEQLRAAIDEPEMVDAPRDPRLGWISKDHDHAALAPAAAEGESGEHSRIVCGQLEKPKRRIRALRIAAVIAIVLPLAGDVMREGAGHVAGEAMMDVYRDRHHYLTGTGEAVRRCAEDIVTAASEARRLLVDLHRRKSSPPTHTPDQLRPRTVAVAPDNC